ncbi:MAG TPA: hypothetical protein VFF15_05285 [Flavobacteriaceae bacterium]|nr:hypothetical protein [Flavobacteriaceae bacterium]
MLILFQSCKVYHKDTVTLEQAAKDGRRAKIETTTSKKYVFKTISYENDTYYGINKIKGKTVKIPLEKTKMESVRLENKSLSTVLTLGLFVAVVGAVVLIKFASDFSGFMNGASIPAIPY